MELTYWNILQGFIPLLFVCQEIPTSESCDRDTFLGQPRIDRIAEADIVLYGEIKRNRVQLVESNTLHIYVDFEIYCVIHNAIFSTKLTELLEEEEIRFREVYHGNDCVDEQEILNVFKNVPVVVTLTYDSDEELLLLQQVNTETGIHVVSQVSDLISEMNKLADETQTDGSPEDKLRNGYRRITEHGCENNPSNIAPYPSSRKYTKAHFILSVIIWFYIWKT